jgi:hypothetical protein
MDDFSIEMFNQNSTQPNKLKIFINHYSICHNPSLGFMTKARACKGVGQEGSLGITFHAPGNVGKFEGMNPHTPK